MRFRTLTFLLICLSTQLPAQDLPVELRVQSGHYNQITATVFSPDGALIASGGYDQNILIWDKKTGRELRRIECSDYIRSLHFSPDGEKLLSVLGNGVGQVHEVKTGKRLMQMGGDDPYLRSGRFLPDGKRFITAGGEQAAYLWALGEEEPISIFEGERSYCSSNCQKSIDVSPDGKWLLTLDRKGVVSLWNVRNQKLVRTYKHYENKSLSFSGITAMEFLQDSETFIVGSEEEGLIRWSVKSADDPEILLPAQRITSGLTFMLMDLAINTAGTQMTALYLEGVQGSFNREEEIGYHLYDLEKGEEIKSMDVGSIGQIATMTYSPVADTLLWVRGSVLHQANPLTGESFQEYKGHLTDHPADYWIMRTTKKHLFIPPSTVVEKVGNRVMAWDFKTGKLVRSYPPHKGLVIGMALSPDTTLLATGGADREVLVSDVATGDTLWRKEVSNHVFAVAFSPDGEEVITALLGGRMAVWKAKTGEYVRDLPYASRNWYDTPLNLAFTGTGLITWGDFLKDYETGEEVVAFDSHEKRVHDLLIIDEGKTLLTTSWDDQVYMRDLYYGGKVKPIGKASATQYCLALSADGRQIAAGGEDNLIRVHDLDGEELFQLAGHTGPVVSLSYTPDDRYLISGSQDGTTRVWDLEERRELYTHILLDENRWTTKLPSGHFYATQEGMESMFFVRGTESYSLDRFFEEFYQPKLAVNLLGSHFESNRSKLSDQIASQPPPKVEIIYPKSGTTQEERVELLVRVTNQGGGVDEIKLLHNGKRIVAGEATGRSRSAGAVAHSFSIDLVPGVNVIQASAFSSNRIESAPDEVRLVRPVDEPTAACYVVSIGINQYKNPRLNLNYAVDDAKSMASLIQTQGQKLFTRIETHLITDEDATRENILAKLQELSAKIKPTDVFYFFYAGHGSILNDDFYFIPVNCIRLYEEAGLKEEALHVDEIVEQLKQIKALKQVLFVDACHSGGSTAVLASRGAGEEKALAQLSRSAGVHILAAAGSDQTATEYQELGHGLFTYVVLEALSGEADGAPADNKVTVYELKSFLDDRVPEYSQKYKNVPQYPNTFSIGHDFPIVLKED